jgi:hypothetical protein
MHLFRKEDDFAAFQRVMVEAHQRQPIRISSYCVLSNRWHFVVRPEQDGESTDHFFRCLAHTVNARGLRHTVRPEGRPSKASQFAKWQLAASQFPPQLRPSFRPFSQERPFGDQ